MRQFQMPYDGVTNAQSTTEGAIWSKALTSTASEALSIPSGAKYASFTSGSTVAEKVDIAAEFGLAASLPSTTTQFPSADSTSGASALINPSVKYLDSTAVMDTIRLSANEACNVTVELFRD